MSDKKILDVTCGSRTIWFNKHNPAAIYCDIRKEELTGIWKANTERMKSSGNDDGEDGVVIVNDAPTGEDIRHSDTEVPADIQQQDS